MYTIIFIGMYVCGCYIAPLSILIEQNNEECHSSRDHLVYLLVHLKLRYMPFPFKSMWFKRIWLLLLANLSTALNLHMCAIGFKIFLYIFVHVYVHLRAPEREWEYVINFRNVHSSYVCVQT